MNCWIINPLRTAKINSYSLRHYLILLYSLSVAKFRLMLNIQENIHVPYIFYKKMLWEFRIFKFSLVVIILLIGNTAIRTERNGKRNWYWSGYGIFLCRRLYAWKGWNHSKWPRFVIYSIKFIYIVWIFSSELNEWHFWFFCHVPTNHPTSNKAHN